MFVPSQFHQVTVEPIGLGMGKLVREEFAACVLHKHVVTDQPFDQPFQYAYDHSDMVPRWLNDHGGRKYTLTQASLELLFRMYGKK